MTKTDMRKMTGITTNTIAKMGKKEPISMEALGKICEYFDCRLEDIVEYVPESTDGSKMG